MSCQTAVHHSIFSYDRFAFELYRAFIGIFSDFNRLWRFFVNSFWPNDLSSFAIYTYIHCDATEIVKLAHLNSHTNGNGKELHIFYAHMMKKELWVHANLMPESFSLPFDRNLVCNTPAATTTITKSFGKNIW